jgi:hypothetical protein
MGTFKTQKMAQMRATSRSAAFQVFKRWSNGELQIRFVAKPTGRFWFCIWLVAI